LTTKMETIRNWATNFSGEIKQQNLANELLITSTKWHTIWIAGCGASKEGFIVNQQTTLIRFLSDPRTRSVGIAS
jgi:hypothetical protein